MSRYQGEDEKHSASLERYEGEERILLQRKKEDLSTSDKLMENGREDEDR